MTTWTELTKAEPRLRSLYNEICAIKDDKSKTSFCANEHWYGYEDWKTSLKTRMYYLVGFHANGADPVLHTMKAYDLAYEKLYTALPDCRNCRCMALMECFGLSV